MDVEKCHVCTITNVLCNLLATLHVETLFSRTDKVAHGEDRISPAAARN